MMGNPFESTVTKQQLVGTVYNEKRRDITQYCISDGDAGPGIDFPLPPVFQHAHFIPIVGVGKRGAY